jgi:CRP/FNR family transcriptional regulator
MSEFETTGTVFRCPETTVLFSEEQLPCDILFLLEGRVKLSMNSIGGRRLILGISRPGNVLGLTAAVSGLPYEMTAEAQYPCRLRSIQHQNFLDFIMKYSVTYQNVARELSLEHAQNHAQLRLLGLTSSAAGKLARLLIDWCSSGHQTEHGIRIQCSLTQEEIGEHIGVSRETTTRTLSDFKQHRLIEQRGSIIYVLDVRGLEAYAGSDC